MADIHGPKDDSYDSEYLEQTVSHSGAVESIDLSSKPLLHVLLDQLPLHVIWLSISSDGEEY